MAGIFEGRARCLEQEQFMMGKGKVNVERGCRGQIVGRDLVCGVHFAQNMEGDGNFIIDSKGLHGYCRGCR